MEDKIYIFDNTKLSKTKDSTYTFKELIILNPKLLEEIFNSNNKYRLTDEAIKSLCKIKRRFVSIFKERYWNYSWEYQKIKKSWKPKTRFSACNNQSK